MSVVPDTRRAAPDVAFEEAEVAKAVRGLLNVALSDEERAVVELKYGLSGHRPHTTRQICEALDCTTNQVQAVVQRALRKLRREAFDPCVASSLGCEVDYPIEDDESPTEQSS